MIRKKKYEERVSQPFQTVFGTFLGDEKGLKKRKRRAYRIRPPPSAGWRWGRWVHSFPFDPLVYEDFSPRRRVASSTNSSFCLSFFFLLAVSLPSSHSDAVGLGLDVSPAKASSQRQKKEIVNGEQENHGGRRRKEPLLLKTRKKKIEKAMSAPRLCGCIFCRLFFFR